MSKGGYVYIIASLTRRLYIGVTSDLERRMAEHRAGVGSAFAARYNMTRLVYYEQYGDIRDAIERESSSRAGGGKRRWD